MKTLNVENMLTKLRRTLFAFLPISQRHYSDTQKLLKNL